MTDLERRSQIEVAIDEVMRRDQITRRTFLRRAGRGSIALGALATLPGLLAACGPSGSTSAKLRWLNWTGYIDIDDKSDPDPTQYPTINAFIKQSGIDVEYNEGLLDNAEFLAQYAPDLKAGNSTGWDVMSPGGWVVERMARNDYLMELDHSKMPNWTANCADYAKGLWFDPDNTHSIWWQGGITGIGYDPALTGREITSFEDLLDPAFSGRVGGFSDMRDMFGLTLLWLGVEPAKATVADVQRAQQKLLALPRGHFRGFYGNEYYDALAGGDLAISVAWSGDVGQIALNDNPNVKFVVPVEGGMRWNDNLVIPKGTANVDNALKLLDYWYDPVPATLLSEYIGYFTPVKGVDDRIRADAETARADGDTETADYYDVLAPQVLPSPDQLTNIYPDKELDEAEETEWNKLFEAVLGAP